MKGALDPFRDQPPGPAWRMLRREKDFTLYEKIADRTWPPWANPDRGPCSSRAELEPGLDAPDD